jgi:hypothetical protein
MNHSRKMLNGINTAMITIETLIATAHPRRRQPDGTVRHLRRSKMLSVTNIAASTKSSIDG